MAKAQPLKKAKNILIVESPAKASTIERYLGSDYKVIASYGHIRDLPKSRLGIDVEHNFAPDYITPKGSGKKLDAIKKAVAVADTVYLATDLDREGEAIAWHIKESIPARADQPWHRITFAEITKDALKDAVAHPREINEHLVDAQQARRILDRLVGYSLSPVLWKKIRYGLSAGRVQSVALQFIVDREREIEAFKSKKYWLIFAKLSDKDEHFSAELTKVEGKKSDVTSEKDAKALVDEILGEEVKINAITEKEVRANPRPPFITSTLQQAASSRLGYGTRRTMQVAQKLYEAGIISYMRTDSVVLSAQALAQAHSYIKEAFGAAYALDKPRVYSRKAKQAQEAHEAIRPTDFTSTPASLDAKLASDELKLYTLIWQRAIASQMASARYKQMGIDLAAGKKGRLTLHATGRVTLFDGFTKAYPDATTKEDNELPKLHEGDTITKEEVYSEPHETQPPPRYNEASLVKKLESEGIGRPSTYAPTISTIISRGYVLNEDRRLVPQPIGLLVADMLKEHFSFVVDPSFTAKVEDELDDIAVGKAKWQPVVEEFYKPMDKLVKEGEKSIEKVVIPVKETDEVCELCGKKMVIKQGRFGEFMACSGWPECKNTKPILKDTGMVCPKCHEGAVVERKTKKGRKFYGCSRYPDCDYATWTKPKKTDENSI